MYIYTVSTYIVLVDEAIVVFINNFSKYTSCMQRIMKRYRTIEVKGTNKSNKIKNKNMLEARVFLVFFIIGKRNYYY